MIFEAREQGVERKVLQISIGLYQAGVWEIVKERIPHCVLNRNNQLKFCLPLVQKQQMTAGGCSRPSSCCIFQSPFSC